MIRQEEESITKLKTDYIDIGMLNPIEDPKNPKIGGLLNACNQLIKKRQDPLHRVFRLQRQRKSEKVLEMDFREIVPIIFSHPDDSRVELLMVVPHKKGISFIVKKVFAGIPKKPNR